MRWHNVLIYQDEKTKDHMLLVDNSTTTLNIDKIKKVESKLSGKLYFGSNPLGLSRPSNGYRGCISSLRINENAVDLFEDADSRMNVNRGCNGEYLGGPALLSSENHSLSFRHSELDRLEPEVPATHHRIRHSGIPLFPYPPLHSIASNPLPLSLSFIYTSSVWHVLTNDKRF